MKRVFSPFLTCLPIVLYSQEYTLKLKSFPPEWEKREVGFTIAGHRLDTNTIGFVSNDPGIKNIEIKTVEEEAP